LKRPQTKYRIQATLTTFNESKIAMRIMIAVVEIVFHDLLYHAMASL